MKLLDSACCICTRQASDGRTIRNKISVPEKEKLMHRPVYQFSFMVNAFWILFKKSLLPQVMKFSPVLSILFLFPVFLELIFVYGVRKESLLVCLLACLLSLSLSFFFNMVTELTQHCVLKTLSFPSCSTRPPLFLSSILLQSIHLNTSQSSSL